MGFAVEVLEIVDAGGERIKPPAWGGDEVAILARLLVEVKEVLAA